MAYELPEQVAGLNLSATPEGPPPPVPGSIAPQVASTNFGMVNLPGYTSEQRAQTLEPTPTFGNTLGRIGLAMEAMGAGYQGQEPLYLKLRRQQAVEDQLQTDRALKVDQFRLDMQKRSDAIFQQGVAIAMDDGKPIETRMAALEGMSKQNPSIAALKPLITKQVLQDLPMAKDYLSPDVMKAIEGIQRNPNGKVDFPGGLTGIAAEIKNSAEFGRANVKEQGLNIKEQQLKDRYDKDGQLNEHEQKFLVDRKRERDKLKLEFDALGLTNRKLEAEANRPKTLEVQMGNQMVTLQETVPGSGKWEQLVVGGQPVQGEKKPLVQIDTSMKASEEAVKKFMANSSDTYQQLKTAPVQLRNLEEAKKLIPGARGFMGPFGETKLEVTKFLNSRLGMSIDPSAINSAEELRTRIFQNVLENLKKMDAQPSQYQQVIMMESLGKLGTDPNALTGVIDAYADIIRGKVDLYNQEVSSAEKRGVKFPYDPIIKLAPKADTKDKFKQLREMDKK